MGNQILAKQILAFIFYIFLQVAFGKNIVLWKYGFCFPFLAFLLNIPFGMSRVLYLLIAFATGLCIDIAYNTIGFHAAACVLMAFSREYAMKFISPGGGYEIDMRPTVENMGLQWFISYAFMLIFIHHTAFFLIETSNFTYWSDVVWKILCSTLFTLVLVLILQSLYFSSKKRRRR